VKIIIKDGLCEIGIGPNNMIVNLTIDNCENIAYGVLSLTTSIPSPTHTYMDINRKITMWAFKKLKLHNLVELYLIKL
jgi:hypothetical protein